MLLPPIHRVVTGHDAEGKSIIASEGPLATVRKLAALPGMIFHEVWSTHSTPAPVDNGSDPTLGPMEHSAPENGTRIRFVDFPPDASYLQEAKMQDVFKEVNGAQALTAQADSPHPMMHRSEAVDYAIVTEGEMTMVLDGCETTLRPGSVVVQRGTNHAWANRTDGLCRVLFIQISGRYDASIAAKLASL